MTARLRLTAALTVLIGAVALLGTAPFAATAQGDLRVPPVRPEAPEPPPDLRALIEKIESRYGGRVLEIEREDDGERGIYEIELLGGDGQEHEIRVNLAGEKLPAKEHHGKH